MTMPISENRTGGNPIINQSAVSFEQPSTSWKKKAKLELSDNSTIQSTPAGHVVHSKMAAVQVTPTVSGSVGLAFPQGDLSHVTSHVTTLVAIWTTPNTGFSPVIQLADKSLLTGLLYPGLLHSTLVPIVLLRRPHTRDDKSCRVGQCVGKHPRQSEPSLDALLHVAAGPDWQSVGSGKCQRDC
ncbi:hypothetical protein XELAEV_18024291mg [Xenopus laevis]|uniref:Uncharacterized protein n=1 Tax=Xenopus laevis TaxID=8355 RepID=A0A974HKS0_XENLA|nr:hypothetical protein XELAEV_18024291mg [Xenopus laevis]